MPFIPSRACKEQYNLCCGSTSLTQRHEGCGVRFLPVFRLLAAGAGLSLVTSTLEPDTFADAEVPEDARNLTNEFEVNALTLCRRPHAPNEP